MKNRRRWYISWVGLRGAVPIVFATYPLIAGVEKANIIFNIVFFISVTSVLLQGTTLSYIAKIFHVALPEKVKPRLPMDLILSDNPKAEMEKITITEQSSVLGKQIVELNFPRTSLIAMIEHNGKYTIPAGTTKIKAGDILYVLSENSDALSQVYHSLNLKNSKKVKPSHED